MGDDAFLSLVFSCPVCHVTLTVQQHIDREFGPLYDHLS